MQSRPTAVQRTSHLRTENANSLETLDIYGQPTLSKRPLILSYFPLLNAATISLLETLLKENEMPNKTIRMNSRDSALIDAMILGINDGTYRSLNNAAVQCLGGPSVANSSDVKRLTRYYNSRPLDKHMTVAKPKEQLSVEELQRNALERLRDAEEIYAEIGRRNHGGDFDGGRYLMADYFKIMRGFLDSNVDVIQGATADLCHAIQKLTGDSWKDGDSFQDKHGNETECPHLLIKLETSPMSPIPSSAFSESFETSEGTALSSVGVKIFSAPSTPREELIRKTPASHLDVFLAQTARDASEAAVN